jgi:predicted NBD/HSP70 family sugar kinase
MRTGRKELIRDLNRSLVLNLVREHGALSRADLARATGLSPSTVTAITASLLADGFLLEDAQPGTSADRGGMIGRPATLLRVDPGAGHVIGIKLAPETLTAAVADLAATPLASVTLPHRPDANAGAIAELFEDAIAQVRRAAHMADDPPLGIGIGVPGMVDPASGRVTGSPLPAWAETDLTAQLERRLGLPVLVENDVNTLTVAEQLFGSGRGLVHFMVVTIGRGIGMGVVVNGVVYRGARGGAGEIGHVTVVPGGHRCWCGREGCLETVASEPSIARDVLTETGRLVSPDDVAALSERDARVAAILERAGRHVGHVIAAASMTLDPQRVIVSGEGVRLGRRYLDAIREGFAERRPDGDEAELLVEPWGDDAWARGAAALVLRELFHPAHLRDEGPPAASHESRGAGTIKQLAFAGRGGGRS